MRFGVITHSHHYPLPKVRPHPLQPSHRLLNSPCSIKAPCLTGAGLDGIQGKRVAISGSGNVAIYAAYKCIELGAKVITLSDSGGYHIVEEGMTKEMVDAIDDIKVVKKGRLSEYQNPKGESCLHPGCLLCVAVSVMHSFHIFMEVLHPKQTTNIESWHLTCTWVGVRYSAAVGS